MHKLLLAGFALALCGGAVAQTSQPAPMATGSQPAQTSEEVISSNGPVVADYRAHPTQTANPVEEHIAREVRHELLMLPHYSLFDDLEYSVQGRNVTLNGSLTSEHSQTREDAERAVKRIEGVENVVNHLRVLPPSPFDDQARERVYRALARSGGLSQYFWEAAPSIHIIVEHQRVILKGYVNSEGDKNLANIAAKEVPEVFQVVNELQVIK